MQQMVNIYIYIYIHIYGCDESILFCSNTTILTDFGHNMHYTYTKFIQISAQIDI